MNKDASLSAGVVTELILLLPEVVDSEEIFSIIVEFDEGGLAKLIPDVCILSARILVCPKLSMEEASSPCIFVSENELVTVSSITDETSSGMG